MEQGRVACALAKKGLGAPPTADWTGRRYQAANRLAWLWFAHEHQAHRGSPLPVWLVSVYFCGGTYDGGRTRKVGPASPMEWRPHIDCQHDELEIDLSSDLLSHWMIELFPQASGPTPRRELPTA